MHPPRRSRARAGGIVVPAAVALLLLVAVTQTRQADAAAPEYGVVFGSAGGTSGPRAIFVPTLTFAGPLSIEFWVRIDAPQADGARLIDFGNPESVAFNPNVDSLVVGLCSSSSSDCSVTGGAHALRLELYVGSSRALARTLLDGAGAIPAGAWTHVLITWANDGSIASYKDGAAVDALAGAPAVPSKIRLRNFLGRPNEWGKPYVAGVSLAGFALWNSALTASDAANLFAGTAVAGSRALVYPFNDCALVGNTTSARDASGTGRHALLVGDVAFACPPSPGPGSNATAPTGPSLATPAIATASAASPVSVALTITLSSATGVSSLLVRCAGFGGPFVASTSSVTAAGTYIAVPVSASYAGGYSVSCSAIARNASGYASRESAAVAVAVPAGVSLAAQTALMPSGKSEAANTYLRVGNPVASSESQEIVFAAPLANYILGQRPAAHRMGIISRSRKDYYFCDYDLDACRCTLLRKLSGDGPYALGSVRPTDFTYTSMSPWPARNPDTRFDPSDHASTVDSPTNWPWDTPAYERRKDLLGDIAGSVLKPQASCDAYDCYTFAAQRFAAYAFAACSPGPYGSIRPWPVDLCAAAAPYDFYTVASQSSASNPAKFKHDFRHFYASYERHFYEAVSGLSSAAPAEKYDWAGFLGTFHLFRPTPTGSRMNVDEYKRRHFRLLPELLNYAFSRPDKGADDTSADSNAIAFGSHYFFHATNCLDFYDAEAGTVASGARTFEGEQTSQDVKAAYSASTYSALLLHDLRYFSFWQRGVAFFGSFVGFSAGTPRTPSVVPLLKACSLPLGVAILRFDSYIPTGQTADASAIFKRVSWPGEEGAGLADAFPPGATVIAVATDGRIASGGPLLYHALARIPTFPATSTACPTPLVGGSICASLSVTHVTAIFSWSVTQPASTTPATPATYAKSYNASFDARATFVQTTVGSSATKVLRTDAIPLADHWIVQNERPLHAGMGHGYLEGRWVDPPAGKFAFYVTGDKVVRLLKTNSYQSGMAGSLAGTLQIYGAAGWAGTRANWTSVAAAAYKDGNLYVVQELHTPANTRTFTFASESEARPRLIPGKRMRRSAERAPGSRLLRISNADATTFATPTVKVDVIVPNFPANVLSGHVVDDYSSTKMFGFGAETLDPGFAFTELPWVVFMVSDPPTVIKLHTQCPPGQRWNWEAAVFNRSVANADLCIKLPAGRFSASSGLLLDTDAAQCPAGQWSAAGSTVCTKCQKGTFSEVGSGSCYDCPQHTYSLADGNPCTPCDENRFTASGRWTFDCIPCPAGNYLKAPRESSCLACPANQYSSFGALRNCSFCAPGTYPSSDRTRCVGCPAGEYQAQWAVPPGGYRPEPAPCLRCPPGTWSAANAYPNCSYCPLGQVPNDRQDGCEYCRPGYFAEFGAASCVLCPADHASASASTGGCLRCGLGQVSLADRLRCFACPAGTYEALPGECQRCPINHYTASEGRWNCTACAPGWYSSTDLTLCFECYPGQYRSANMTYCETVPAGAVAPRGSANYTFCPNGTVPNFARSYCVPCAKGTYKDPGGVICRGCELNTVASSEATVECEACAPGYVSAPDFQKCLACSAGTYRSANMSFCTPVPFGAAALSGSPMYTLCDNGSIPNMGRSECVKCPKGTYRRGEECPQCPLNHVAWDEGTAECTPCPPGQIAAADLQTCLLCPGGTYRSENHTTCQPVPARSVARPGQALPTECEAGRVPNGPKTECIACRKGTYQDGDICRPCPLNQITSFDQAYNCTACDLGTVASADSQTCIRCPMGTYRSEINATCIPTPPRASALQGSAIYTVCANGTVPNVAKSECIPCRSGTYQVEDACLPCPINSIAPRPGHFVCEKCPEGYVAAADSQTCIPCMGGLYRHEPLPSCLRVPSGAVAMPGSRNYTICGPGTVPNPETTSCTRCGKGTYERGGKCRECIGNTYAPEAGMTACLQCAPGTVASFDRQGCDPCPAGSARGANESVCKTCADTFYANQPGLAACEDCPPGTESSPDRVECILCRSGSYERNGTCVTCPEGFVSAIGETSCRACDPGSISNAERSQCSPCTIGTYKPRSINLCLLCRPGTYAPEGTPNECLLCDPGFFPSADQGRCLPCDPGFFQPNGTLECVRCPWNHFAAKAGTPFACEECPAGYTSAPGFRSCDPCPVGFFRTKGANSTACEACPPATVARAPGSAVCEACPAGKVPREDRADCKDCEAGSFPVNGTCFKCAPKTISAPGDATCGACPPGHVATASRVSCEPCPAAMYLPPSSDVCLRCPVNTIANPGSAACTPCKTGYVSDETQTFCTPCAKGSFRNATMAYCDPCPAQTFAAGAGSGECQPCTETQLCPAATSEPIDVGFYEDLIRESLEAVFRQMAEEASPTPAPAPGGVRVRALRAARRLLAGARRAAGLRAVEVELKTDTVTYDTNTANITRAAIPTEEPAVKEVYRVMTLIGAGVGAAMVLVGLAILVYLKATKDAEARAARAARVAKLDFLYTDVIAENQEALEEAAKKAEGDKAAAAAAAPAKSLEEMMPGAKRGLEDPKAGAGAGGKEAEASAAEAGGKKKEEEEGSSKSVLGAVFTIIGVGFIIVAVCFVLLQYALANYQIIESLLPGSSPSVAEIAGIFEVSASFRGYFGVCEARRPAFSSLAFDPTASPEAHAGVYLDVTGISPLDGEAAPAFTATYNTAQKSCFVVWRCGRCRMTAAANVSVDFRLVSRLAFAVAVNYVVRVPNHFSIVGVVTTSAEAKLNVFRGSVPVRLPSSLTPIHFENAADGEPRYDAALEPADNRAAERDAASFGLCSLTLPLLHPTCRGEVVGFTAAFDLATVYLLVSRVIRATALDMLADLAALGGLAVTAGAQLVVAYFYWKKGKLVVKQVKSRRKGGDEGEGEGDGKKPAGKGAEKPKADKGKGPAAGQPAARKPPQAPPAHERDAVRAAAAPARAPRPAPPPPPPPQRPGNPLALPVAVGLDLLRGPGPSGPRPPAPGSSHRGPTSPSPGPGRTPPRRPPRPRALSPQKPASAPSQKAPRALSPPPPPPPAALAAGPSGSAASSSAALGSGSGSAGGAAGGKKKGEFKSPLAL
eukprot:tig00000949_g5732.t1